MKIRDTFLKYLRNILEKLHSSIEVLGRKVTGLNYKLKVIYIVIIISTITQGIYIFNYSYSRETINKDSGISAEKKQFDYIYKTLLNYLNDVDLWSNNIKNSDAANYTLSHMNLKDKVFADEEGERVNRLIDSMNISPLMIKKIYMLAGNSNHRSYVKEVGFEAWEQDTPTVDILEKMHLDKLLFKGNELPVLFQEGELQRVFESRLEVVSEKDRNTVQKFIKEIEGNIVLCKIRSSAYSKTFIISILNPAFFKNILELENSNLVTLMDSEGGVLWRNYSGHYIDLNDRKSIIYEKNNGEWLSALNGESYVNKFETLSPQKFKIIYSVSKNGNYKERAEENFIAFITFSLVSIVSTFIAAILVTLIIRPFNKLAKQLKKNDLLEIKYKDINKGMSNILSKISLKKKFFSVFIIALLIPQMLSSFFYATRLYNYYSNKLQKNVKSISKLIELNIKSVMESSFANAQLIPANKIVDFLFNSEQRMSMEDQKIMDETLLSQSLVTNSFSYFVLLDKNGAVKYQSVYSQNKNITKVPLDIFNQYYSKEEKSTFYISNAKDVYNQATAIIVRKILGDSKGDKSSDLIGYLQMFLKPDIFLTAKANYDMEIVVLNKQGELVYKSNPSQEYYNAAISFFKQSKDGDIKTKKVDGVENIIVTQINKELDFKIYCFQKLDYLKYRSEKLLIDNLTIALIIFILIIFLSFGISKRIAKSIEDIKVDMLMVGNGNFNSKVDYDGKDEISELVKSYNNMVNRINELITENANEKVRAQQLLTLKTQAELNMLQNQINPHFLYNTLENISVNSVHNDDGKAAKMATLLARLFRYTCNTTSMVKLTNEIEHAQSYIAIQQMRFKDKFVANWKLDAGAQDCTVLKFILQPIIENCINHGLYNYTNGGIINISTKFNENYLMLEVSDNGIGMRDNELEELMQNLIRDDDVICSNKKSTGSGIGLKNVYRRIMLYYEGKAEFFIHSRFMRGTKITINIPVVKNRGDGEVYEKEN